MFLILSMTASGSVLALLVLWLRQKWTGRLAGVERWLWLIVLLRLCIPLPGPVNLMGEVFQNIQGGALYLYTSAEEEWMLERDKKGNAFFEAMQRAADAAPEDVEDLPLGAYTPEVPIRIPLPGWFRLINPNTWLAVWAAGAVVRLCWALFHRRRDSLCFGLFAEAVLSLHWFNPLLMGPVHRTLAERFPPEPAEKPGRWAVAGLAAAGVFLGVLPGGAATDLFRGAEYQLMFELNEVSITGQEALDRFVAKTERGHPAFLRVVRFNEGKMLFAVSESAETVEEYPDHLWLIDVYFDGECYHSFEPGADIDSPYRRFTYPYLVQEMRGAQTAYLLTNDPDANWYDRFLQSSIRVENPVKSIEIANCNVYS